jgi:hypothetical protein
VEEGFSVPARVSALLLIGVALLAAAARKTTAIASGENQDVVLTVTLHLDPEGVKRLVGDELGGHYIVAEVKVEPKYGKEVRIDRDDFVLRTDKDGERTKPFVASQIAGRGAIVVSRGGAAETGGVSAGPSGYPGGYPGGYPPMGGPPVMMPGGVGVGGGSDDGGTAQATPRSSARDKENPLEKVLEDRMLPEKKTDQPVSGLLYFAMEKQKMKDLELTYGGREDRIRLRFK